MEKSAVDFAVNRLAKLIPSGNQILIRAILIQAKEMEREQKSYSEEEVHEMFDTLKRNSIDNVATINNVDLFINSWKQQFKKK